MHPGSALPESVLPLGPTGLELDVLGCAVSDSVGLFSALVGFAGQYCAVGWRFAFGTFACAHRAVACAHAVFFQWYE